MNNIFENVNSIKIEVNPKIQLFSNDSKQRKRKRSI